MLGVQASECSKCGHIESHPRIYGLYEYDNKDSCSPKTYEKAESTCKAVLNHFVANSSTNEPIPKVDCSKCGLVDTFNNATSKNDVSFTCKPEGVVPPEISQNKPLPNLYENVTMYAAAYPYVGPQGPQKFVLTRVNVEEKRKEAYNQLQKLVSMGQFDDDPPMFIIQD